MSGRLAEQVAIVTGGAAGIGAEVARCFAAEGAFVAIADRDHAMAERTAAEIRDSGGNAAAFKCDVTREGEVAAMVDRASEEHGRLDILINNAGVVFAGTCSESSLEDWNQALTLNLTSAFLCCKYAIPKMLDIRKGGVIVNVSALGGLVGVGSRAAYMSAKAGLLGLTRSITFDYATKGIRCNAVCPATTRTAMLDRIASASEDPEAWLRHVSERQFIGRMAEPAEIATAILFLASPDSSYLYGVCLPVDGGVTATSPRA